MGGVIKPCALVNPFRTYPSVPYCPAVRARGGRAVVTRVAFLSRVRATRDAARLCARPGARLPGVARRGAGVRVGVECVPGSRWSAFGNYTIAAEVKPLALHARAACGRPAGGNWPNSNRNSPWTLHCRPGRVAILPGGVQAGRAHYHPDQYAHMTCAILS